MVVVPSFLRPELLLIRWKRTFDDVPHTTPVQILYPRLPTARAVLHGSGSIRNEGLMFPESPRMSDTHNSRTYFGVVRPVGGELFRVVGPARQNPLEKTILRPKPSFDSTLYVLIDAHVFRGGV